MLQKSETFESITIMKITAITDSEYRSNSIIRNIYYCSFEYKLFSFLIASTESYITDIFFLKKDNIFEHIEVLKKKWYLSTISENMTKNSFARETITNALNHEKSVPSLILKGTPFQINVWKSLTKIEYGALKTYKDIAISMGKPESVRAVSSAVGKNPIALIIPCHRVIGSDGKLHGYRWGIELKKELLKMEMRQSHSIIF